MATTFKNALSLTGLSQREAALFFDVREDTVKSWCAGRNNPPQGVWVMLAKRMRSILEVAYHAADSALDTRAEEMARALAVLMAIDDLSARG